MWSFFRKKIKPYSDNVIFFDTEFSSLDPYKGEILSIAMIKPTGEELYLELEYNGEYDPWVVENILPTLIQTKISREEAARQIITFIGDTKPYLISYVDNLDMAYWFKLMGNGDDNPCDWLSVDLSTILFSLGINPKHILTKKGQEYLTSLDIDATKYTQHNALDDARLLRDIYFKFAR